MKIWPFLLCLGMFYIYILYSKSADKYYVGQTSGVERRVFEHNNPTDSRKFTSKYLPWELKLSFPVSEDRGATIRMERFIKAQKSRIFVEKLIQNKGNPLFFDQLLKDVFSVG